MLVARCQRELDRLDGVDGEATDGGPREELSRLGEDVGLLIIGSRRYGQVHRLFYGTTSTYLARHLACPLLQLPRPGDSDGDGRRDSQRSESAAVPAG